MNSSPGNRQLLILDLDETLIYASDEGDVDVWDFEVGSYKVKKRPYVQELLAFAAEQFDMAVWTSSVQSYGQEVVQHVFPDPTQLQFLWSRSRCTWHRSPETGECYWGKNLKKVRQLGYALERVVVTDNEPRGLEDSYGNLIRVKSFFGQPDDEELRLLVRYLTFIKTVDNVTSIEKRN